MIATVNEAKEKYLSDEGYRIKVHHLFRRLKPFIESVTESHALKLEKWYLDDPMWIVECDLPKSGASIRLVATPDDAPGIAVIIDGYEGLFGSIHGDAIQIKPHLIQSLLSRAVAQILTCNIEQSTSATDRA